MDKSLNCHFCHFRTRYGPLLIAHMQTHADDEQLKQSHSSRVSSNNDRQKRHSVCEMPFKCTECSYGCADHSLLLRHCKTHATARRARGFKPAFVPAFEAYSTAKLRALDKPKGIPLAEISNNGRINTKATVLGTESVPKSAFNPIAVSSYSSSNKKCPAEKEIDQIEDDICIIGMNPVMKPIARYGVGGFKPVFVPASKTYSTVQLRAIDNPKGASSGETAINSRKGSQANVSESIRDIECTGTRLTPVANYLPKCLPEKKIEEIDDDCLSMNSATKLIACNTVNLGGNQSTHTDKWCAHNVPTGKGHTNSYADALITVSQSVVDSAPILLTTLTPMRIFNSEFPNTSRLSEREIGQVDIDNCLIDMYCGMNPGSSNMVGDNFSDVEYTDDGYFHCDNDENLYMESAEEYDRSQIRDALISNGYNIYRYL